MTMIIMRWKRQVSFHSFHDVWKGWWKFYGDALQEWFWVKLSTCPSFKFIKFVKFYIWKFSFFWQFFSLPFRYLIFGLCHMYELVCPKKSFLILSRMSFSHFYTDGIWWVLQLLLLAYNGDEARGKEKVNVVTKA